ncbi:MotA/TolQ/ExbB proton channel family protein [Alkalimarinus sediminis]|uniref:MotA/TolQ/ExbB proton channel family protein n=1 Tax=Alkalimarinus sediminis TaxID=1632866 RepID=A0A9E8KQL8_9ALTE|nr:MotA/TolQ/ExbB proton channel family protein [Alkalimarinus sediminis]UZW76009.1 MotA/TolQ/ExbB proton channel family protein [Alkalimarinus sediminis]
MTDTVVRFFQEGGAFMYPIAIVLVLGIAIAIERFIYLSVAKNANRSAFDKAILPLLKKRDYKRALEFSNDSSTAIASIMGAGLSRLINKQKREDIEYAMEEGLMETLPRLEKRTQYLATLANVSTLLGLLGTIIGLIAAFTAVANADPAEKASLLSQSISVAMNTTAFGLMSAIPLLLCHAVLQTKTNEIVDSFEMAGVKLLNIISEQPSLNRD